MEHKKTISELYKECKQNVERIERMEELREAYHIGNPEYYTFHDNHNGLPKANIIWTFTMSIVFLLLGVLIAC